MKFKDKRVLIIGAGASGRSAEAFLQSRGAKTFLYDDKLKLDVERLDCELAVLSPGVSINHELAQRFRDKLISELALGFTVRHKKIVAVTGTNGKTSVVNLIHQAMGDKRAVLCGNCGPPVTSVSESLRKKIPITEVSSYMMETEMIKGRFRPRIAVILNITQDHLDRHGTIENYIAHKEVLAKNQKRRDVLILNYDCANTKKLAEGKRQKILWFSTKARVRGIYAEEGRVWLNTGRKACAVFDLGELGLHAEHQIQNFLATALVCALLRVKRANLKNLRSVEEHRIEFVKTIDGASYYNDSKGTNTAATLAAINSFSLPVHLILGGKRKGQDFAQFFAKLPAHVASVCVYGEDREHIAKASTVEVVECEGLEEAVRIASVGQGPRVVLLSPACASFDQFRDYVQRGERFREIIEMSSSSL